ncbi:MAG: hypothetical protein LBL69_05280 [Zoogloeaceae bacterium]|jgi:hypothetical protein|nr:hypothetical protein [Zoogloeaceae bacterium]
MNKTFTLASSLPLALFGLFAPRVASADCVDSLARIVPGFTPPHTQAVVAGPFSMRCEPGVYFGEIKNLSVGNIYPVLHLEKRENDQWRPVAQSGPYRAQAGTYRYVIRNDYDREAVWELRYTIPVP